MRILKISRSTLYRLRKEHKIEYEKIGGTYYYPSLTFTRIFDAKLLQKKIIRSLTNNYMPQIHTGGSYFFCGINKSSPGHYFGRKKYIG